MNTLPKYVSDKVSIQHILGESSELSEDPLCGLFGFDVWSAPAPTQQRSFRAAHAPQKAWT